MASLEERVAGLEGQTDRYAVAVEALRADISDLRVEQRTNVAQLRGDIAAVRGDMALRTETVELRREMGAVRSEMGAVRSEMAAVRSEMAPRSEVADLRADLRELSRRWDHFFIWMAGTQVATLLAVIGVLAGILFR